MPINTGPFSEPDDEFEQWLNKTEKEIKKYQSFDSWLQNLDDELEGEYQSKNIEKNQTNFDIKKQKIIHSNSPNFGIMDKIYSNFFGNNKDSDHYRFFINTFEEHIDNWGKCLFVLSNNPDRLKQYPKTSITNGVFEFNMEGYTYEKNLLLDRIFQLSSKSTKDSKSFFITLFNVLFSDEYITLPFGAGQFSIVPILEEYMEELNFMVKIGKERDYRLSLVFYPYVNKIVASNNDKIEKKLLNSKFNLTNFLKKLAAKTKDPILQKASNKLEHEVESDLEYTIEKFFVSILEEKIPLNISQALTNPDNINDVAELLTSIVFNNIENEVKIIKKGTAIKTPFKAANVIKYGQAKGTKGILFNLY